VGRGGSGEARAGAVGREGDALDRDTAVPGAFGAPDWVSRGAQSAPAKGQRLCRARGWEPGEAEGRGRAAPSAGAGRAGSQSARSRRSAAETGAAGAASGRCSSLKSRENHRVLSAALVPWETPGPAAKQPQDPAGQHAEEQPPTPASHGQTQPDSLL